MKMDKVAVEQMGQRFKDDSQVIGEFHNEAKKLIVEEVSTGKFYRYEGRRLNVASEHLWRSLMSWQGASDVYGARLKECSKNAQATDIRIQDALGSVNPGAVK